MAQTKVRTRIAPSPTGFPHVGTVFQGLIDYVLAKNSQGDFLVRIEDTDQSRRVEGAEEAIYDALDWVGLTPDESTIHDGKFGPYRQSERLELYQQYADQLIEKGQAYYCFCSPERLDQVRKQMQKDGRPPMYDRHCRDLDLNEAKERAKSEKYVVRMKVPDGHKISFQDEIRGQIEFDSSTVDDQVILKSDGFPTYHLAVVVDDHLMQISHVVRGEEWITSTPKHVLLYEFFDWDQPKWIHTPVLRNPDKSKLSKRHGHASVTWYQEQGYLPEAVLNFLATRVWNHPEGQEVFDLAELIKHFQVKNMHIQGPIVDLAKLNWYNGLYIRQLADEELFHRLRPYASKQLLDSQLNALVPLIKERLVVLSEVDELSDFVYAYEKPKANLLTKKADTQIVLFQLESTIKDFEAISDWQIEAIEKAIRGLQENNDWHRGQYFMMVRLAATGKTATPPLFETLEVLGKDEVVDRLRICAESLG